MKFDTRFFSLSIFVLFFPLIAMSQTTDPCLETNESKYYTIDYQGRTYDGAQTTFTWTVTGQNQPDCGIIKIVSLEVPECTIPLEIADTDPSYTSSGNESMPIEYSNHPFLNKPGISWFGGHETPTSPDLILTNYNNSRDFQISFKGNIPEGNIDYSLLRFYSAYFPQGLGQVAGPGCITCGDGVTSQGEACDDGNSDNFDGCRNDCSLPVCGDKIIDAGEDCDDGNLEDGDGCSSTCLDELDPFSTCTDIDILGEQLELDGGLYEQQRYVNKLLRAYKRVRKGKRAIAYIKQQRQLASAAQTAGWATTYSVPGSFQVCGLVPQSCVVSNANQVAMDKYIGFADEIHAIFSSVYTKAKKAYKKAKRSRRRINRLKSQEEMQHQLNVDRAQAIPETKVVCN